MGKKEKKLESSYALLFRKMLIFLCAINVVLLADSSHITNTKNLTSIVRYSLNNVGF